MWATPVQALTIRKAKPRQPRSKARKRPTRVSERHREVGVIVARRTQQGAWGGVTWAPVAILAAAPALQPGSFISRAEVDELYYAGSMTLELHASETAHYRDNLQSGRPSVWIALTCEAEFPLVNCVTADPYEGEALAEIYGEGLDAVPMPPAIRDDIADFVAAYHVERVFVKRKRT